MVDPSSRASLHVELAPRRIRGMFLRMPITMRDNADAGLALGARCRQCRKVVVVPPEVLIRRFPTGPHAVR